MNIGPNFIPNDLGALSNKLKNGAIQKSQSQCKEGYLKFRQFLNRITFGLIEINPKMDRAIEAITNAIQKRPDIF